MAEALLRQQAGDRFEVYSAGLEPKGINPVTVQVMNEIGVRLDGHRSKSLYEYMGKLTFDTVITVCGHADESCPAPLWAGGGIKLHWPFDDPAAASGTDEAKLAKFREVRDQINQRIKVWLDEREAEAR